MLDLLAQLAAKAKLLRKLDSSKPLTLDSTCYEARHRSRHYDRVCRKMLLRDGGKYTEKTDADEVNRSRSRRARQMPKLALAVASACHLILAARVHIGCGSDAPDFAPLLYHAWRRANVNVVVADAGYDSEANHRSARLDMGVRSVIPTGIGRPSSKPPGGRYRRLMKQRFARKADRRTYGQRAQSETVNSMMKRNFGDALRSVQRRRRRQEMLLRTLTHDLMIYANYEGRD
ncbi:transposase [Fontivita pretiosa]